MYVENSKNMYGDKRVKLYHIKRKYQMLRSEESEATQ